MGDAMSHFDNWKVFLTIIKESAWWGPKDRAHILAADRVVRAARAWSKCYSDEEPHEQRCDCTECRLVRAVEAMEKK